MTAFEMVRSLYTKYRASTKKSTKLNIVPSLGEPTALLILHAKYIQSGPKCWAVPCIFRVHTNARTKYLGHGAKFTVVQ